MKMAGKVLLLSFAIFFPIVLFELMLRAFLPLPLLTIGDSTPLNAQKYGWGYAPHSRVIVSDPDAGSVYSDLTNSRGWRDTEHSIEPLPGFRRILILGDSNTFGANVEAGRIYPRVLQRMLSQAGLSTEVISLAYGGWATDQALEALINEGLSYRPDIVILQFTLNDLGENTIVPEPGYRDALEKPFYYSLDEQGQLVRRDNPYYEERFKSRNSHSAMKSIVASFEILKRAYIVFDLLRHQWTGHSLYGYPLDKLQVTRAKLAFDLRDDDALIQQLDSLVGTRVSPKQLEQIIDASPHSKIKEGLTRILSDVWINQYWEEASFHLPHPATSGYDWQLYHALMREIRARTPEQIPVLLLSDHEQGYYDWQRYWYRISSDDAARQAFFAVNDHLISFSRQIGVEFVPLTRPHPRFRLDPHPNEQGHEAMAQNLFDYLLERHRTIFEK
ncbi:MAG: SGNH/GDSL hydrolase family protein [Alphaproteobacteria bacterium]|nr:SGNH/GDSL hydrolase family protein [Alphaproteobacteria bacterium]